MEQQALALEAAAQNAALSREERAARAKEAADLRREMQGSQQQFIASQSRQSAADRAALVAMQQAGGKVPPGYRQTVEGNLEAIPGGPADVKQAGVFNADTAIVTNSSSDLDRLAVVANELKNHPGLKGITGIRGAIPNVPGTSAADAEAKLNTLKSQVAFGVLQNMRNNSKTGGALGNVSDAEGKRLEANLAALEKAQSYDEFKSQLDKIVKYTEGAKGNLRSAFNLKHEKRAEQRGETKRVVVDY